jgi:hypothetical protein
MKAMHKLNVNKALIKVSQTGLENYFPTSFKVIGRKKNSTNLRTFLDFFAYY